MIVREGVLQRGAFCADGRGLPLWIGLQADALRSHRHRPRRA